MFSSLYKSFVHNTQSLRGLFAGSRLVANDTKWRASKEKTKAREIPRRHKPVLQWQGHHVPGGASRAHRDKGGKNLITKE